MSKKNQLIIFALVVVMGLLLMDTFLFGKSRSCRCVDSIQAQEDCYAACQFIGECLSYTTAEFEGSCDFFNCVFRMINYCSVTGELRIKTVSGTISSSCPTCDYWI